MKAQCLLCYTLILKAEIYRGGEGSKERITVMLCTNANGMEKLQPLAGDKYESACCFKAVTHFSMPI
jgi:hypothetical protein